MSPPQIAHAKLIPMNGDQVETDESKHIDVQFNLRRCVTPSNTPGRPTARQAAAARWRGGAHRQERIDPRGRARVRHQRGREARLRRPGESETVAADSDVRTLTKRIAETFAEAAGRRVEPPAGPGRCRFQWGSFQFTGMLSILETLTSRARGHPVARHPALTFREDRYQFCARPTVRADDADAWLLLAAEAVMPPSAAQSAGRDPRDWRVIAELNRLDNPRFTVPAVIPTGGTWMPLIRRTRRRVAEPNKLRLHRGARRSVRPATPCSTSVCPGPGERGGQPRHRLAPRSSASVRACVRWWRRPPCAGTAVQALSVHLPASGMASAEACVVN